MLDRIAPARPLTAFLVGCALVVLTACAPPGRQAAPPTSSPSASASPSSAPATPSSTPSPDATRPALDELELSAEGLGPLRLGVPPDTDPETRLVAFEPEGCVSEELGIAPGDPAAGLWRTDPAYTATDPAYGPGTAFGVGVDRVAGTLGRIDLYSSDIPTDGGVRIGDPGSSVLAAHPDATVVDAELTDIFVVAGPVGTLQIEVAKDAPELSYGWADQAGTVVYIHAVIVPLGVFSVAASGNVVGVCPA